MCYTFSKLCTSTLIVNGNKLVIKCLFIWLVTFSFTCQTESGMKILIFYTVHTLDINYQCFHQYYNCYFFNSLIKTTQTNMKKGPCTTVCKHTSEKLTDHYLLVNRLQTLHFHWRICEQNYKKNPKHFRILIRFLNYL